MNLKCFFSLIILLFSFIQLTFADNKKNNSEENYQNYKDVQMWLKIIGQNHSLYKLKRITNLNLSDNYKLKDDSADYFKYLKTLTHLNLSNTNISDEFIKEVSKLISLQNLNITNTKISDQSINFLINLTKLKNINISQTNISYEGLKKLKKELFFCKIISDKNIRKNFPATFVNNNNSNKNINFSSYKKAQKWLEKYNFYYTLKRVAYLDKLNLKGEKINNKDLKHIVDLKNLRELSLSNTKINDSVLIHLKKLPNLKYLYLSNTKITDKGLIHLNKMKSLRILHINGTKVTTKGLKHLSKLFSLGRISLANLEKVSDIALVSFRRLKNLRLLDLRGTKITKNAIIILKNYLTRLSILR